MLRIAAVVAAIILVWLMPPRAAWGQYYLRASNGAGGSGNGVYRPPAGLRFNGQWSTNPQPSFPTTPPTRMISPLAGGQPTRGILAAPLPPRASYSMPYGPSIMRPPGSPIVPFGSSRYYYK